MSSRNHPRSVAVGVDGSPSALRAVRWAAGVALRDGVPLRLVHAYDPLLLRLAGTTEEGTYPAAARTRGVRWIDQARETTALVAPALPVEVVLVAAPVAETLLEESATASLLALGTRRLSGFTGLLVGSISVTVAGHADCPVVIVRGRDEDEEPPATGPVVVGVDPTDACESAFAFAFAEASVRAAELVAVHAWTETRSAGPERSDLATSRQQAKDVLAGRLAGWRNKYPDVRVREEVMHDRPGRALSHHSHSAQLIVLGRRGGDGFPSLTLGSTSQYLLHHARCPVVVTKYEPPSRGADDRS